jgi:hypothetical protein
MAPEDFAAYQALPLLKATDYPKFDPNAAEYQPPAWLEFVDRGVDSIFGSAPGGPHTPSTSEELIAAYDDGQDRAIRHVSVGELEVGDYLCHPDTAQWWILDEEPLPGGEPDTTVLVLRNVYTGAREESEVPTDTVLDVRDLPESHLTPA